MKTPKELQNRYPYMFTGQHLGISVCKGWFPIFAKLCQDVDDLLGENKQGFHWVQVKEKFGSARFYWELDKVGTRLRFDVLTSTGLQSGAVDTTGNDHSQNDNGLVAEIAKLEMAAEAATAGVCAACGEPGARHSNAYFLTLCQTHAIQREDPAREGLDMWFAAEDWFIWES